MKGERISGFEKAVIAIELFGLSPLRFEELENLFKVTMFAVGSFVKMSEGERMQACYQHSMIQYFGNGGFNNTSLRKRFVMFNKSKPQIQI